jgi:hypothetical protein
VIEIHPGSTIADGGTGKLEVDLFNNSATNVFISAFQIEVSQPSGSGLTFQSTTTGTTAFPYIFSGNSGDDADFGGSLLPSITATTISGSEAVLNLNSFASIPPEQIFGLAELTFTASANAPIGSVSISIVPESSSALLGTLLVSYPTGGPIAFVGNSGTVMVTPASAVPEPSSLVLAAVAVGSLGLVRCSLRLMKRRGHVHQAIFRACPSHS